ncbi:t-SNARE [Gonapodya prolifera JEL478]|uniref:t-SNARE n=1 Tax=Gonapodya prolifera (strain JEL478) TaxID=1344416 RepID=A0A139AWN3_GONPJ|nr:t-SNARE [Gonapodya prolifera JEL478]|eukprot:KXS20993.1 t-SNARE [Gonapodya prolifera JEL478]
MATRSRTLLFLQYRNSFARTSLKSAPVTADNDKASLLANGEGTGFVVEMSVLPPKWVDIVEEVEERMDAVKLKLTELQQLHKKSLLPGFDDRRAEELSIKNMTQDITDRLQDCQRLIKRVQAETQAGGNSKHSAAFSRNIQTSLATKLQELTSQFRKAQSGYLQKLRGHETTRRDMFSMAGDSEAQNEDEWSEGGGFTDDQLAVIESNEAAITQREKDINQIAKSIHTLAEIFRDMQTMVIDQGTMLDRIDYNIEQTAVYTEEAVVELNKGAKYQKSTRTKLFIILLSCLVLIMLVILIFKPRKSSSSTTNPTTKPS